MNRFRKLSLVLAALSVTSLAPEHANAMFRSDLQTVRAFVEARDDAGLRQFLSQNPHVLDNTVLGRELAAFMESSPRQNVFIALGFANPIPVSIRGAVEAAKSDPSLY